MAGCIKGDILQHFSKKKKKIRYTLSIYRVQIIFDVHQCAKMEKYACLYVLLHPKKLYFKALHTVGEPRMYLQSKFTLYFVVNREYSSLSKSNVE